MQRKWTKQKILDNAFKINIFVIVIKTFFNWDHFELTLINILISFKNIVVKLSSISFQNDEVKTYNYGLLFILSVTCVVRWRFL